MAVNGVPTMNLELAHRSGDHRAYAYWATSENVWTLAVIADGGCP